MQDFMIALFVCSVVMSILALLYIAATPLISKRYSAKGCYYAWLIIIVGLIIPFRPQWGNALVQIAVPGGATMQILSTGSDTAMVAPDIFGSVALPPAAVSISWWQIAAVIWLSGALVLFAVHSIRHYRFMKMLKRWNESITDERMAVFQDIKDEMGITKKIGLYQNSDMGSPIMYGFINPCVILPSAKLAEDELRFILKHELVHYKRKDICYKFLVLIATAIHWFNPFVYLIERAINAQCEISCDAEVVRGTDAETRVQYSEAIFGVVKYRSKLKSALSTNFYGGIKGIRNRVSAIMDEKNKRLGTAIITLVIITTIGTGFVFAVNAYTATPSKNIDITEYSVKNNEVENYEVVSAIHPIDSERSLEVPEVEIETDIEVDIEESQLHGERVVVITFDQFRNYGEYTIVRISQTDLLPES